MDGGATVILGRGESGKTTLALHHIEGRRAVVVAADFSNPTLLKWNRLTDRDPLNILRWAGDPQRFPGPVLVRTVDGRNPALFDTLEKLPREIPIVLDEITKYTFTPEMKKTFINFARGIRYRNGVGQECYITTHRMSGDLGPVIESIARKIYVVGPVANSREVRLLYDMSHFTGEMDFPEFLARIRQNPRYDFRARNKNAIIALL